jgi:hypothetical protein
LIIGVFVSFAGIREPMLLPEPREPMELPLLSEPMELPLLSEPMVLPERSEPMTAFDGDEFCWAGFG